MKRRIISFSGGFDSTLALINAVKFTSDQVICFTVYHKSTGSAKLKREQEARKRIIDYLSNKYHKTIPNYELVVELDWDRFDFRNNQGLSQPIFWICNIAPFVSNDDTVIIGYNKDDQATAVIEDIKQLWNTAMKLQFNKQTKLEFPLMLDSKSEIIRDLIAYDSDIIDMCISCESTMLINKPCGSCIPCNSLKSALMQLVAYEPKNIASKARELLKRNFGITVDITYDK